MTVEDKKARQARYVREWNARNRDKVKDGNLRKHFGITLEDFKALLDKQNGVCAICGNPETTPTNPTHNKRIRDLAVDHSHTTGKVRGLLCRGCNQGLGNFRENPNLLSKAISYLLEHAT